jgi:hypothetical protein
VKTSRIVAAAGMAAALAAGILAVPDAHSDPAGPSLVRVLTPTREARDLLTTLGLDLTEHAGDDFVEVVLHDDAEAEVLRAAGLEYDTVIADLWARERQRAEADAAFAAANPTTALPSGRNAYRTLEDYNAEMEALATEHPDLVSRFTLPFPSVEGRDVYGIEVAKNPGTGLGRPVMVMLGVHHAREWPSGEMTMEFANELVNGYATDPAIRRLVERVRVLFVPVVNVDGFNASITDGAMIDLRELGMPENDPTGTGLNYDAVVLGNPGNAYKRKNCRIVDGADTPQGACAIPGNRYLGIDLNRNYGSLWGGNGASALPADDLYRGPAPFSEPETQNVRALVSSNQVTMLITNHTFSNLVLRPPGVRAYGFNLADELAMTQIGARMAAQNGYANQHGWQLYDTTGTTEDWSYLATGGYGYTFEIGPNEFHPPFEQVVDEYLGAGDYAGRGNRAAYLIALEAAADQAHHVYLHGNAPAGATLRVQRAATTETSPVQLIPTQFSDDPGIATGEAQGFEDVVESSLTVPAAGRYSWHLNPSTRPAVGSRVLPPEGSEVTRTETVDNTEPSSPGDTVDVPFSVSEAEAGQQLVSNLDWLTPDDYDLEMYKVEADGSLTEVGSSGELPGFKEEIIIEEAEAGDYVLRVVNYAAFNPAWTLTTTLAVPTEAPVVEGTTEAWTITCERDGEVRQTLELVIDRGENLRFDFTDC